MKSSMRSRACSGILSLFLLFSSAQLLASDVSDRVNINTATASELAKSLKGIGPSKAQAIVDYRKAYGPFSDIQQLSLVKGIGDKLIEQNQHSLSVTLDASDQ